MPRPLSDDLRVRLLEAVGTIRAVGERFGVAPSSVSKIRQRWRWTGGVTMASTYLRRTDNVAIPTTFVWQPSPTA